MGGDRKKDTLTLDAELPQHTVYLPDFSISRVPVTNEQYKEFVDATGHQSISTAGIWLQNDGTVAEPRRATPKHWKDARIPVGMEKHPVVHINWHDAQAFCRWAGVRLPTEAEWEKACRGTDGWLYPWGNEPPTAVLCNFANGNAGGIMPVGCRPKGASPYGVLDMAGNIWEWTSSLDRPYPYQADDGREAPDAIDVRVVRGGAFHLAGYCVRCAARSRHFLSNDYWDVGFRVALSPFGN